MQREQITIKLKNRFTFHFLNEPFETKDSKQRNKVVKCLFFISCQMSKLPPLVGDDFLAAGLMKSVGEGSLL